MPASPQQVELAGRVRSLPRIGWLLSAAVVLLVLIAGNYRLISATATPQWDAADFFGPSFALSADEIRAGRLVTWNPWTAGGSPDWTEPELGTASPLLLAAGLLQRNPEEGFVSYWLAVWAFGGIGMLLLARHLGSPPAGAAIAACGFIASGFYTGHAEHTSSIYSVSFLPWIVWRLDVSLRGKAWWPGVQAGALYGLSALGGYPAYTIMIPGFLFLWAVGRTLWTEQPGQSGGIARRAARAAITLPTAIVLGMVICSVSYWGILSGARGYSDRVGPRPRDLAIASGLLPAGALSTFASPYLANLNFPPKQVWPQTDISMTSVYAGTATLVLALFAFRWRSGWRWWLMLMGVFFICCALGNQFPVRGWLYDFVPPTRYFRNPALFRAFPIFIAAVLAALGARDLGDATVADRRRLCIISIILACAGVVAFAVVVHVAPQTMPGFPAAVAHLVVCWFGIAAAATLLAAGWLPARRFVLATAALAFLDATVALYISQPSLYTPATLGWWRYINASHNNRLDVSADRALLPPDAVGAYPNNRNILLKTAVFESYITLQNRFQEQIASDADLRKMAVGSSRFWFCAAAIEGPPDDTLFNAFRGRVHGLAGRPVLVVHSREQMLALSPRTAPVSGVTGSGIADVPACLAAPPSNVSYTPDSLAFTFSARSDGYLLVTDRWADGWNARVNDRPQPVLGGNFIFRAVAVKAGSNAIHMKYEPRGFWPLLILGWGTLLIIAVCECAGLGRRLLRPLRTRGPSAWGGPVTFN